MTYPLSMARPLRPNDDGFTFHALSRGNGRQNVFHDDADRHAFLASLGQTQLRYPFRLYGYCLMTNHFHLLLRPEPGVAISRVMQSLLVAHTWRFHKRHHGVGHVWQGRFKSPAVQDDDHLWTVLRYIEANPLRAAMFTDPADYPWSSFPGARRPPPRPVTHRAARLGRPRRLARGAVARLGCQSAGRTPRSGSVRGPAVARLGPTVRRPDLVGHPSRWARPRRNPAPARSTENDQTLRRHLAAAGWSNDIFLLETANWTTAQKIDTDDHEVNDLQFAADGQHLASIGFNHRADFWDRADGRLVRSLRECVAPGNRLSFSRDGHHLAATGGDRSAWVWDRGRQVITPKPGAKAEVDPDR